MAVVGSINSIHTRLTRRLLHHTLIEAREAAATRRLVIARIGTAMTRITMDTIRRLRRVHTTAVAAVRRPRRTSRYRHP